MLPFLPLFVRELGVEEPERAALWAGVLIGVAPLLAGLLAPVWGRLADRHGHKGIAVKALVAYVVLLALCAAVTRVEQLLALRIGIGLFGGIGPLGLAMAAAQAPREETGRAVGLVQAAQILSAAIGPFAGGLLADAIGIRRTFLVTAALCALALVLVLAFYEERGAAGAEGGERRPGLPRRWSALPGVVALLVVLFVVNFIGRSFTPILPLHLGVLGVPAVAPRLGHRRPHLGLLGGRGRVGRGPWAGSAARARRGACCSSPSWAAPPSWRRWRSCRAFEHVLGLAVLLGLVSGGSLTLCYTIGGLMVPEAVRTTAFGFFSGAALFGGALSPTVAGLVAHVCAARDLLGGRRALRRCWPWPSPAAARCGRSPPARLELESRHEDLPPLRPRAAGLLRRRWSAPPAARTATPT